MSNEPILEKSKQILSEEPPLFGVAIHNDNYTPIEWVTELLIIIFGMSELEADAITMQIHEKDKAVIGRYSRDLAESKVQQVNNIARANDHPLLAEIEQV